MRSLLARGLAALVVAGCLAAVAPAAHAETWQVRDDRRDVQRYQLSSAEGGPVAARRDRSADIVRMAVRHTRARVTVEVEVRRLFAPAHQVTVDLDLPGRASALVYARRGDGRSEGLAYYTDGRGPGAVRCATRLREMPRRDTVRISVRRACLERPRWVRANATVVTTPSRRLERARRIYVDTVYGAAFQGPNEFGPRVYAG
jgi:hypothetical protein